MVTVGLELKKVLFCYSYDVNMRILADMSAENECSIHITAKLTLLTLTGKGCENINTSF